MPNNEDLASGNGHFHAIILPKAIDGTDEEFNDVRSWKLTYNLTLVLRFENRTVIRTADRHSGAEFIKE